MFNDGRVVGYAEEGIHIHNTRDVSIATGYNGLDKAPATAGIDYQAKNDRKSRFERSYQNLLFAVLGREL